MMSAWFAGFLPALNAVSITERLRGALGALVGILLTSLISSWAIGTSAALPLLIAPMGASAVLLFAVPASPLAQPWSIIGGNAVAALVGVTAMHVIHQPLVAAPVAVGIAVAAMVTLRCIHPPGGAVALTAVLGGPAIVNLGYGFVLSPVLLNSVALMLVAIAFNNVTRRPYPHPRTPPKSHGTSNESPMAKLGFSTGDLDMVLKRYDQILDVSREDMESLFQQAEMEAYRRRFKSITCGAIMSRDVIFVEWGTPLREAWLTMRKHRLRAMPVVDRARHVVGLVSDADFMNDAGLDNYTSLAARFHRLIQPPNSDYTTTPEVVGQIMDKTVETAAEDVNIVALVPMLAGSGRRYVPIVDADRHLVGIIAQSDLIAALYRNLLDGEAGEALWR